MFLCKAVESVLVKLETCHKEILPPTVSVLSLIAELFCIYFKGFSGVYHC